MGACGFYYNSHNSTQIHELTSLDNVLLHCQSELDGGSFKTLDTDASIMFEPFRLHSSLTEILCPDGVICSYISFKWTVLNLMDKCMQGMPLVSWTTLATVENVFHWQLVQNSMHNKAFDDSEDLQLMQWYPISVALIVDVDLSGMPEDNWSDSHLFKYLLPSIRAELVDLTFWAQVRLVIGYASFDSGGGGDEEQYSEKGRQLCKAVRQLMPGLDVACFAVDTSCSHSQPLFAAFAKSDFVGDLDTMQSRPVYDIRGQLLNLIHKQFDPDYYLLLDSGVLMRGAGWLLSAVWSLRGDPLLSAHIGAGMLHCPTSDQQTAERNSEVYAPLLPVLQRSHFELFANVTFFPPSFPRKLNNLLLADVYSAVRAYHRRCGAYDLVDAERDLERYVYSALDHAEAPAQLEAYVDQVHFLRRHLLRGLNSEQFAHAPIAWDMQSVAYGPGDLLYGMYCSTAIGCEANHVGSSLEDDTASADSALFYRHPEGTPAKVAYITAVFGSYEATLKPFARQTVPADFICFTDNPRIANSNGGWVVDSHPHHWEALQREVEGNHTSAVNALHRNTHPFNLAKYYKLNLHRIPRLRQYEVVVWLDGTVQLHNENTSAILLDLIVTQKRNVLVFETENNWTTLLKEAQAATLTEKYYNTQWMGHQQPVQDVMAQYRHYLAQGYDDEAYWPAVSARHHYGLWITCFVAFDMRSADTAAFLDLWSEQNLRFSTQDQVSFPYVAQTLGVHPFSLPESDSSVVGGRYFFNSLFVKHHHGY